MKTIIMKSTISYINQEASLGNQTAIEFLIEASAKEIQEKEYYVVLIDKNNNNEN